MVIWFIGKSASGKTYIGQKLYEKLKIRLNNIVFLDGDKLRNILSKDLGHSVEERFISEQRRSRLAKLLSDQKIHVIVSGISNEPQIRQWNRKNIEDYYEIYLKVKDEILYERDPKNIYKNFKDGKIKNVVGEDIKFIEPSSPWMTIDNNLNNADQIIKSIIQKLKK